MANLLVAVLLLLHLDAVVGYQKLKPGATWANIAWCVLVCPLAFLALVLDGSASEPRADDRCPQAHGEICAHGLTSLDKSQTCIVSRCIPSSTRAV